MHARHLFVPILLLSSVALSSCALQARQSADALGDAQRGANDISKYGCGSCHTIQGITGAKALVGPPLSGIGSRLYVAGMLLNNPENIALWVEHPHNFNPKTVMPELGVTRQEATDIAAYLTGLK